MQHNLQSQDLKIQLRGGWVLLLKLLSCNFFCKNIFLKYFQILMPFTLVPNKNIKSWVQKYEKQLEKHIWGYLKVTKLSTCQLVGNVIQNKMNFSAIIALFTSRGSLKYHIKTNEKSRFCLEHTSLHDGSPIVPSRRQVQASRSSWCWNHSPQENNKILDFFRSLGINWD